MYDSKQEVNVSLANASGIYFNADFHCNNGKMRGFFFLRVCFTSLRLSLTVQEPLHYSRWNELSSRCTAEKLCLLDKQQVFALLVSKCILGNWPKSKGFRRRSILCTISSEPFQK